MDWITVIGLLAGFCTTIAFLPQVIKAFKSKKTEDISLLMYVVTAIGVSLWIFYGITINNLPIILANCVTLVLVVLILILKIIHK